MTKLKSLKDLPKSTKELWSAGIVGSTDTPLGCVNYVDEDILKREAIKWLEAIDKYGVLDEGYCQNEDERLLCKFKRSSASFIKHFFNI